MNTGFDLTVVLTAHDETLVCGPTLAAARAAITTAEAAGITVERLVALDRATPATKAWFAQPALDDWPQLEFDEGDLGRVRNAILPRTKGRFIAFLDADDLYSENWLRDGVIRLRAAEKSGQRAIVHPELNWLFDGAHSVFLKPEQDDPLFSPYHFYFMNYYDSLCMAPRDAHLEHPYVHRDIPAGLSFQDWQFSIQTMAAGWQHVVAPDTIIFKRRRDASLVSESRTRRALVRQLDPMAIDRVAGLGGKRRAPARPLRRVKTGSDSGVLGRLVDAIRPRTPPAPTCPALPEGLTPHYGPVFAARVARAQARRGAVQNKGLYDTVNAAFDHAYYLARYPDILALEEVDPVAHYIRAGAGEGRDPTPFFSTRAYLRHHPRLAKDGTNPFFHWLTKGQDRPWEGAPFADFDTMAKILGQSPAAAFDLWRARYGDLRTRLETGALGQQVVRAARHEPLIEMGWPEALQIKIPALHSDEPVRRTTAIWRLMDAAGHARARFVICVNRARFGAAPRVEGHLARALVQAHGADQVLVITTDRPGDMPEHKLPVGVRHVDFATLVPDLRGDPRQRVLAEFLRALRPAAAFNVNSRLMWDMMTPYGTALSASMRLYASLLCNEKTATGHWTGYPLRRVYRHFDQLSAVLTDSEFLADDLRSRHLIPPDQAARVQVLPNPVDATIALAPAPAPDADRRPQVFWAGRLDAQKRVDLVFAIAAALPGCDFRLWGAPVMGGAPLPDPPGNVTLEGAYAQFADLPLHQADLWLYTSGWDGVPQMLLEVAMTGLPLVGADVGGTTEVLRDGLAHTLPADASPHAWAQAIRTVLANPDQARNQALILRKTLIHERSPQAHARRVTALPGCAPEAPS